MDRLMQIHPRDNVAVVIHELQLEVNVKPGHKVALEDIQEGACIIKYGMPIGVATCNIEKNEWVHTHNMRTGLDSRIEYRYNPEELIEEEKEFNCQSFLGYERKQGKVGVRNELWIIPTVGCVNSIIKMIEHEAKERLNQTESMDAIVAFTHPYGCSQMSEDQE